MKLDRRRPASVLGTVGLQAVEAALLTVGDEAADQIEEVAVFRLNTPSGSSSKVGTLVDVPRCGALSCCRYRQRRSPLARRLASRLRHRGPAAEAVGIILVASPEPYTRMQGPAVPHGVCADERPWLLRLRG